LTNVIPVSAQPVNPSDAEIARATTEANNAEANMSSLVTSISQSDSDIAQLEMQMGALREAVNKALVDFHDAQTAAEQARQGVTEARKRLDETQSAINEAQKSLDEISRVTYRRGSTTVVRDVAGTENDQDSLDRKTYLRTNATQQKAIIDELDKLRTRQANEESMLREARNIAEKRQADADKARQDAQSAIDASSSELKQRQSEHADLLSQRDQEQNRLNNARGAVENLEGQRKEFQEYQAAEQRRQQAEADAEAAQQQRQQAQTTADNTEQARQEAVANLQAAQDAEANAITETDRHIATQQRQEAEAMASQAAEDVDKANENLAVEETNAEQAESSSAEAISAAEEAAAALIAAASPMHDSLSSSETESDSDSLPAIQNPQTDTAELNANDTVDDLFVQLDGLDTVTEKATTAFGDADRETKIETVIARATAQVGVPYAWGGGDANGPTLGIRDGGVADSYGDFNKVGFDCSGLVLYAFAGVGVALPHYTGYQYQRGTKVSPQEMQRGDLIFYGPNAENHVAIYLGDGKMIEAPNSGSTVQISDVRWSGMSPYAIRLL
jgi:hypothetical protein